MSASKDFMCLVLDNGSIVCAGRNAEHQLGQGAPSTRETSWKYVVGLDMVAHTVELGQDVGCAHLINGSMACWGEDLWGLYGNSTTSYTLRVASTATQYANFGDRPISGVHQPELSARLRRFGQRRFDLLGEITNHSWDLAPRRKRSCRWLSATSVHYVRWPFMRCWWTLPTTTSDRHGARSCTNSALERTMPAMLTRGPPVYRGLTAR